MSKPKISGTQSGIAGEYFVAAELSRRGYTCSLTLKNTKGVDVLVSNVDASKLVAVQVKTNNSSRREWLLSKKNEDTSEPTIIYAFVNLIGLDQLPEYYIVPSTVVAEYIKHEHEEWLKTPGRNGCPHNETPMRMFRDHEAKYKDKWANIEKLLSE